MPALFILLPLFGVMVLNILPKRLARYIAFWFATALFLAQITLVIFHHSIWKDNLRDIPFFKIGSGLALDNLTFIMLFTIGIVSLASLIVSRYTIAKEIERLRFKNLLLMVSAGMSGIVMTRDIFSLYVFLEVTAIASFLLIAFPRNIEALEGAFKYLMLSAIATILMLLAIALVFIVSGGTSFLAIRDGLASAEHCPIMMLAVGMFICGLFIKGGLVPFHGWLPDAYQAAPAAVSVLLAGIVTKVAGIYTLIRLTISVFAPGRSIGGALMAIGAISIVTGALAALGQKDFKRMLSYSSVSQVGYIVLGLGAGTELAVIGAVFHLFNHAIFKTLLFVNSAAVEKEVGTNNMDNMGGLSYRMPVTGTTSMIAMFSTCGIPPLAGFWSKLIIVVALWQSAHYGYAFLAIIASIITLAYFLMFQRKVFFGKLTPGLEYAKEASFGFSFVAIVLAAITIGVGLLFPAVFTGFISPVKEIFIR